MREGKKERVLEKYPKHKGDKKVKKSYDFHDTIPC